MRTGRPPKHGHRRGGRASPTYKVWRSMLDRVDGRFGTDAQKRNYAGRGISVCGRWRAFEHFLADMGERPLGTSLDRINNAGPYSPENCRWATPTEQARNRRSDRLVEHRGELLTIAEWSDRTGIDATTIRHRLRSGWPPERALEEYVHVENRRRAAS